MKKIFLCAALMTAAVINASDVIIYANPFVTEESTQLNNVEQGIPAVLWTNTQSVMAGSAPAIPITNANQLQIQNKKAAGSQGRNMLTAPIANFNAPFTSKLSEIASDSIVWTFCFRNNNQYSSKGLDSTYNGNAIILLADQANLLTANGYAIIMGDENSSKTIKFASFSGGLTTNANATYLLASPVVTLKKYWHIRVVYIPSSNTWKLGYYENLEGFIEPDDCTWTDCGSIVNDTYTNTTMSHFGFLNKYSNNNDNILYVKNYKIMAYGVAETPTGIDNFNTCTPSRKVLRDGQLIILREGMEYNVLGQSIL